MGLSVVKVAAGGLPVTIATSGGLPCTEATNGFGIAVTQSPSGGGLAVTGITFGPTIALSASSVLETAAVNTTVGTLSVAGSYTGTPVFTLTDSAGGKFNILGTALRTNAALDYETASSHSITVAVSGVTPVVANRTITISVTDVAEPVIQLTGTTVNENAAVGVNIGTLSIVNSYTGTPTYSLVDSASGKVAISGALLNVAGAIDYETTPTFNITVSVSGITPPAANKVFTVVVSDITETGAPDSTAYTNFVARTSGLDANHLAAYKNLLDGLTTDGFFNASGVSTLLDALWVSATQDLATAKLNLVANRNNYLTGTTTFTADQGINNGTLIMDLNSSTAGLNATASSLSFGVWDGTSGTGAGDAMASASDGGQCIFPCFSGNTTYYRIQGDITAANTVALGWYSANRNGTAVTGYKNGVSVVTGTLAVGALTNDNWYIGTSADLSRAVFVGASLTGTQHANLYARINTYMTEVATGGAEGGGAGVTKNIVTDYGAVGDAQWAQATLSISTNVLTSATPLWVSGDIGKSIALPTPSFGGPHFSTITAVGGGGTTVTLAASTAYPFTGYDSIVAWGTDSTAAFQAFKTAYQGGTVTLTIPAGKYLVGSANLGGLWDGLRNITVNATGATICGAYFQIQVSAQYEAAGHSARTASVTAGALFVTLTTPSQVSRFVVGNYALMTGFDLQMSGYPTNPSLFEYLRITAIDSDSGSPTYGRVTFLTPLVNSYLSTWPVYNASGTDYGGPATLYAMNPNFDHICVVNGLTVAQHNQYGVAGLDLTFNNCVFEGPGQMGPHPTMARSIAFNNCTGLGLTMELDKLITTLSFTGCSWLSFNMQSVAIELLTIDSTNLSSFIGSARKTVVRNGCTFSIWAPGPAFFGYSHELDVSNSVISDFSETGGGAIIKGATSANNGMHVDLTMAGGIITIPGALRTSGSAQWAVADERLFLYDGNTLGSFLITDVQDGPSGSIKVYTDWALGVFPARTYNPANGLFFLRHPAPVCTFTNVTGCAEVVDLSNALAAGKPLNSYTKRTFTGSADTAHYLQMWGRIKKIVVTVTTPYTGSIGTVEATLEVSGNVPVKMSDRTNAATWTPVINLKTAGVRTFDATAGSYPVSWTGSVAGDTLPNQTEGLWCTGNFRTHITDVSSSPGVPPMVFTVEMITDQEVFVPGPSTEATAFLARTSGLDATHTTAYTALIDGLVADGIWAKLDMLHIYATQDSTTALLNLVSTSFNGIANGSPTFTADRGFTGTDASTTKYINTQFNPTTASSPHYGVNDAHVSAWSNTNTTSGASGGYIIGDTGSGPKIAGVAPKYSDGNSYVAVNSSVNVVTANANSTGHYLASRSSGTTIDTYKNAASVFSGANASVTPNNGTFLVLATRSGVGVTQGSACQVAMASIGSSLNSTEVTNFYNRLRTYLTAVGVP